MKKSLCALLAVMFAFCAFACSAPEESDPEPAGKLVIDMSGVSFENATYTYDGTEKTLEITGELPEGVFVYYIDNKLTDVGSIEATAVFTVDTNKYERVPDKTATLTVTAPESESDDKGFSYWKVGGTYTVASYTGNADTCEMTDTFNGVNVTAIASGAFADKTTVIDVTVGKNVAKIFPGAFASCPDLARLAVKTGNTAYHAAGNCIVETAAKTVAVGCKNSVIPDDGSVKKIGEKAFYARRGLDAVTIPDCITEIGAEAFRGCATLSDVVLPDGVTYVGERAFYGCAKLESVTIGTALKHMPANAFTGCTSLDEVYYKGSDADWEALNGPAAPAERGTVKNALRDANGSAPLLDATRYHYSSDVIDDKNNHWYLEDVRTPAKTLAALKNDYGDMMIEHAKRVGGFTPVEAFSFECVILGKAETVAALEHYTFDPAIDEKDIVRGIFMQVGFPQDWGGIKVNMLYGIQFSKRTEGDINVALVDNPDEKFVYAVVYGSSEKIVFEYEVALQM